MFVPFITKRSNSDNSRRHSKRKGGGGGGGGSHGGGGGGEEGGEGGGGGGSSSSGGRSSGSGGSTPKSVPLGSGSSTGGRNTATAYGNGGGKVITIPSGQLFAGRTQGGGSRSQVFGSRTYGSGYPGIPGNRGVFGLGFPFYFWPIVWGPAVIGTASYLHDSEYGDANNSSRPGGPLTEAPFTSSTTNTTLRIVADNATTTSLIQSVVANCSQFLSSSANSTVAQAFDPSASGSPKPEQAVEYYRASSVVLTLDGYNDTAALSNTSTTDTPLPSGIDTNMLNCMNQTIGVAVPLISGASNIFGQPVHSYGVVGLFWVICCLFSLL